MIKFVKFFSDGFVQTLFVSEGILSAPNEQTHTFGSAEEAVAHSTPEAFIVWDGVPVSAGSLDEIPLE